MMHSTSFLLAIPLYLALISTTSAFALPTWPRRSYPELHLHKRGLPGAVYICTDQNFSGQCGWIMPSTECHIPGTGAMAPESIGPDPGGFCVLYSNAKCTGNQIKTLRFPGMGSGLPTFQGIQCLADGSNAAKTTVNGGVSEGVAVTKGGDPRLAGGAGSLKAKKLKELLGEMDESEGMIGLEKDVYY